MYSRCTNCDTLNHVWEDLANTLNETEDEAVAIAKVDCSVETNLCTGKSQCGISTDRASFFQNNCRIIILIR